MADFLLNMGLGISKLFKDLGDGSAAELMVARDLPTVFSSPPSVTSAAVIETHDVGDFTQYLQDVIVSGSNTIVVEGTINGTTWRTLVGVDMSSATAAPATSVASAGLRAFDVSGLKQVRSRVSTFTSGTVTIASALTKSPYPVDLAIAGATQALSIMSANSATRTGTRSKVKSVATAPAIVALKAAGGNILGGILHNNVATARYLKIWDSASTPTIGTTAPDFVLHIPANGELNLGNIIPIPFTNRISYALTAAVGDNDTTAIGADDITGFIHWV